VTCEVRQARPADAPRLAELSGALGYPVAPGIFGERLERLLARDDNTVLVATDGGDVIGWLHGAEHELLETGRHCEILGLIVDARARRSGVGHRLIGAVEEWAASRGLDQIAVRSNIVRVESHPLYGGLGYARVKTQHAYRKQLRSYGGRHG